MGENYLNSPALNAPSVAPAYISDIRADSKRHQAATMAIDVIEAVEKKEEKSLKAPAQRPALPKGTAPPDNDYLSALAKAFCVTYSTMSKTTVSQTSDMANLQTLDQTMSQAVLDQIGTAMKDEDKAFATQQALNKQLQEQENDDKIANIIGYVVGGLLIALTVASALVDFGASLAAVPEEMMEVGSGALTETADASGEGVASGEDMQMSEMQESSPTQQSESTDVDGNGTSNYMKQMSEMMSKEPTNPIEEDQMESSMNEESSKSNEEYSRSDNNWQKARKALSNRWVKFVSGVGGSSAYAIPQFMEGAKDLEVASYQKNYVAPAQRAMGQALGEMQYLHYDFQYCQQLVQRQSGIAQQFISQLSDVLETASSTFSAYRQIPYGLSQAV